MPGIFVSGTVSRSTLVQSSATKLPGTEMAVRSVARAQPRPSPKELLEPTPFELRLKEAFDKMDTDGSGTLDKAELSAALRALGQGEAAVEALLAGITEPELSFEAFCKQMRNAGAGMGFPR